MCELLTIKWEVKPNLAVALIDVYGGHTYDLLRALNRLYLEKEKFDYVYESELSNNV